MRVRASHGRLAILILAGALWMTGRSAAQPPVASFPDVPPWHWAYQGVTSDAKAGLLVGFPATSAELARNALTQVYDGFAHARAPEAQAWIERFTYNRPASWPQALGRSTVARFSLRDLSLAIAGETATVTFSAEVTTAGGQTTVTPMRVNLRLFDGDWRIDYATLAAGSVLFR